MQFWFQLRRCLAFIPLCIACLHIAWAEPAMGQALGTAENVVLITLDGLRPEEMFTGADERLMIEELGVKEPAALKEKFWRESPEERREVLLPFLWGKVLAGEAWLAGDPQHDSSIRVTNGMYFSYPGYNELLSGFADPAVDSNAKKYNENTTVLEWLNGKPDYQGRVAAYCSWDVFPYIINDRRSKIPVNAGWSKLTVGDPARLEGLNFVAENLFREWDGVRYDAFTTSGAIEELRTNQPRVLFVSLGETDDWAHAGRYDRYLITAQQNDYFIKQLWEESQKMEQYRDKTTFIIACDHGRGDGREGWKSHGALLPGSENIWLIAFGTGVKRSGIDQGGEYQQAQVAATVAAVVGLDFTQSDAKIAAPLPLFDSP